MRISRSTLRIVVPPLLALGLVAAVAVRPVDAQDVVQSPTLADTGGRQAAPTGNVSVSVPPVAFTQQIRVVGGRIQTAVLVNVSERPGVATIEGAGNCRVPAKPGVVALLDCAYGGQARFTVRVHLDRGEVYTYTAAPAVS
jgi:hypothetical protein